MIVIDSLEKIEIEYNKDARALTISQSGETGEVPDVVWIPAHAVDYFLKCLMTEWGNRNAN